MTIHYTVVGHFAKDLVPEGYRLGGAVFYSGMQAYYLGAKVSLITSAAGDIDTSLMPPEIKQFIQPAPESTTFENVYDELGNRTQHVRGRAEMLLPANAPTPDEPPTLLQLGPLVAEVASDYITAFPDAKLCVTPQGWMRDIQPDGLVKPRAWEDAEAVLAHAWALVFSEEDVGFDEDKIRGLASLCPVSVCTRNLSGATLFLDGKEVRVPAFQVEVVDPTGAGDVFAASFFIRYQETDDPELAVRFAHAAAGLSIGGIGVAAVAKREAIEALLLSEG